MWHDFFLVFGGFWVGVIFSLWVIRGVIRDFKIKTTKHLISENNNE